MFEGKKPWSLCPWKNWRVTRSVRFWKAAVPSFLTVLALIIAVRRGAAAWRLASHRDLQTRGESRRTEGLCAHWPRAKTNPASLRSLFAESIRVSESAACGRRLGVQSEMPRGSRSRTALTWPLLPGETTSGLGSCPCRVTEEAVLCPWHGGASTGGGVEVGRRGPLPSRQTGYGALGSFPVSANFLISNVHELFLNIFRYFVLKHASSLELDIYS